VRHVGDVNPHFPVSVGQQPPVQRVVDVAAAFEKKKEKNGEVKVFSRCL
jgi:hypothetical protein